jgi:hypothetical protein
LKKLKKNLKKSIDKFLQISYNKGVIRKPTPKAHGLGATN